MTTFYIILGVFVVVSVLINVYFFFRPSPNQKNELKKIEDQREELKKEKEIEVKKNKEALEKIKKIDSEKREIYEKAEQTIQEAQSIIGSGVDLNGFNSVRATYGKEIHPDSE